LKALQKPRFREDYEYFLLSGLFVGIFGPTGCGKTLVMTWFAYWISLNTDVPIYANYWLNPRYIRYKRLKHPNELMKITRGFVFLDEPHLWGLDSYRTRSALNRFMTWLCTTARKRGLSIWLSAQRAQRVDKNVRYNVDYIITPEFDFDSGIVHVYVWDTCDEDLVDYFRIRAEPAYKLYNTREMVEDIYEKIKAEKQARKLKKQGRRRKR